MVRLLCFGLACRVNAHSLLTGPDLFIPRNKRGLRSMSALCGWSCLKKELLSVGAALLTSFPDVVGKGSGIAMPRR